MTCTQRKGRWCHVRGTSGRGAAGAPVGARGDGVGARHDEAVGVVEPRAGGRAPHRFARSAYVRSWGTRRNRRGHRGAPRETDKARVSQPHCTSTAEKATQTTNSDVNSFCCSGLVRLLDSW